MEGAATVWLVGMMGAGKSAVGRVLAQRLGRRFVDADAEVERTAGRSIAEIFRNEGEARFRALERETLEKLAGRRAVVALGGGAIAQPGVAERLRRHGPIVYLRARLETLLERVGDAAGRPLLAGLEASERRERLRTLLEEREPYYRLASWTVDTDGRDVEALVAELAARLEGSEP